MARLNESAIAVIADGVKREGAGPEGASTLVELGEPAVVDWKRNEFDERHGATGGPPRIPG